MFIATVRIKNYRSISDSGELSFGPGFNLVVGPNNVGKSSALSCFAARFLGEPHKSIRTLSYRNEPLNQYSKVEFTFIVSGDEMRRLIIGAGTTPCHFPWPSDLPFAQPNAADVIDRILSADRISIKAVAQSSLGQAGIAWPELTEPSTRLGESRMDGGNFLYATADVSVPARAIRGIGIHAYPNASPDYGRTIAQLVASQIYRFSAERFALGSSPYGGATDLLPDARNLPEVVNALQGNPERFRDYCALVKEVFPSIKKVSVRPLPTNPQHAEIMIWQIDPALERDDLAMPLSQCGTGVGQVLAILYIAKISEHPRTIIIDEPGSFLHPGASRALIQILRRFNQHQYIIATHSPEILAELAECPVTIIRWTDSMSMFEQAPHATGSVAADALTAVGARLSDVFGFDHVIWVEGQSDAATLEALRTAVASKNHRVAILPVRDTGSFRRRRINEVLSIYRSLSMGGALLPPAMRFIFDREGRTETEIQDAVREGRGLLTFLSRRMIENFLLNPAAIARVYSEVGEAFGFSTSESVVDQWIKLRGRDFFNFEPRPTDVYSAAWCVEVDGAALLEELFSDLSEQRLAYSKAAHTPRLALATFALSPASLEELIKLAVTPITDGARVLGN